MKSSPRRSEADAGTDGVEGDWLAPMRSAWKAGIERDEREQSAASERRLARATAPEKVKAQPLRDLLPIAACICACVLGGLALRHAISAREAAPEIHADATPEPATPESAAEPTAVAGAAAAASPAEHVTVSSATSALPAPSMRPLPLAAPRSTAKTDTETLPPLPPLPPPETSNVSSASPPHKQKHLDSKHDRRWLRPAPVQAPLPPLRPRRSLKDRDL